MATTSPELLVPHTITDLPPEILHLMPVPYRSWQLLRMTCRALNARLGDYHKAHNLVMYCRGERPLTYRVFVEHIIDCMRLVLRYDHYVMYKGPQPTINEDGTYVYPYNRLIRVEWSYGVLFLHTDTNCKWVEYGQIIYPQCIEVHNRRYSSPHSDAHADIYEYIYNELPELYRRMKILIPATYEGRVHS